MSRGFAGVPASSSILITGDHHSEASDPLAKHLEIQPCRRQRCAPDARISTVRFGQLHVRTAFPTTGGFDEQVTLFCLHADQSSSRAFQPISARNCRCALGVCAGSAGLGESDPSPNSSIAEAAGAISDLADDLRLRQIDLLGIHSGAAVALELAAARPELVRRLVLAGVTGDGLPRLSKRPHHAHTA